MSDQLTAARQPLSGEIAMSRLADKLATLAPPPLELSRMQAVSMPRPSPAVSKALSTSQAIAARAAERARRSRSVVGMTVDGFTAACACVPYALVALALRLVMARIFFLDGQSRIDGPLVSLHLPAQLPFLSNLPFRLPSFDFSMVLPLHVKADTFADFLTQFPPIPLPPAIAAYAVSYAEFVLPICLVLGFATRFASLGLLMMTGLIAVFIVPQTFWGEHVYWASILLVLISLGGGALSFDNIIRLIARR